MPFLNKSPYRGVWEGRTWLRVVITAVTGITDVLGVW